MEDLVVDFGHFFEVVGVEGDGLVDETTGTGYVLGCLEFVAGEKDNFDATCFEGVEGFRDEILEFVFDAGET